MLDDTEDLPTSGPRAVAAERSDLGQWRIGPEHTSDDSVPASPAAEGTPRAGRARPDAGPGIRDRVETDDPASETGRSEDPDDLAQHAPAEGIASNDVESDDEDTNDAEGIFGTSVTTGRLRATGARTLKRSVYVVIIFFLVNYLVLPQLGGARQATDRLSAVNPVLLLLALGFEVAALVAYAQLTRVTLPIQPKLHLSTVLRIQLSTRAVTNLVPGGSAAGGTLGYRLLTQGGVDGASAGFSLATVGLGSAVVLNLILWVALLISIPIDGFNPVYGTAAIVGMVLMALFAGLVVLLMKGQAPAVRVIRAVATKLPYLNPDTAERFVNTLVGRLRELMGNPTLIRRGIAWATVNWLLDAAALWVFIRAFGQTLSPVDVVVAFCLANIVAVLPITPGGLGVLEATLITTLVGFGLDRSTAAISVVTYRLAQFWLPIPLGAISYASLRVGPKSIQRLRHRRPIRDLTDEAIDVAGVRVWDVDDDDHRPRSGDTVRVLSGPSADLVRI